MGWNYTRKMICKECNGGYLAASQEYYVDEIYASFHRRVHTLCFYIVIPSYPTFANQAPAAFDTVDILADNNKTARSAAIGNNDGTCRSLPA